MSMLDLKTVERELKKLSTITEKLDYWNNVFIENIAKPLNENINKSFQINMQNQKVLLTQLFGNKYTLITSICIPQKLYSVYFEPFKNKAEYSYWFLNRDADAYFKALIKGKNFEEKLISNIAKIHIEKELKQISEFESHAVKLFNDNAFDIYKKYSYTQYEYNQYKKEIEYLRIKENYYQNHYLSDEQFTIVKELYAIHVLFKDYLTNKQYEVSNNLEPFRLLEKDIKYLISEQQKDNIIEQLKINLQNDSCGANNTEIDIQINTLNDIIEKSKRAYLTKTIVEAMQIAEKQYLHAIKLKFDNKCHLAIARFQVCETIKENLQKVLPPQQTENKPPPPPLPKYDTIESIFYNPDNIQKVIDILIDDEILNKNGEFLKKKYEILPITKALVLKGIIIKDVSETQRNKLFACKVNEKISDKTARTKGFNYDKNVTYFSELFKNLT